MYFQDFIINSFEFSVATEFAGAWEKSFISSPHNPEYSTMNGQPGTLFWDYSILTAGAIHIGGKEDDVVCSPTKRQRQG